MAAIEINAENFEEKVIRSDKPVLVDFWAVWCGPCSMMSPIIEQIGEELADKLIVGKVNCDENMELAQQYKVAEVVTKAVGAMSKDELLAQIEPHLV